MKKHFISLLPKRLKRRDALNFDVSISKPRLFQRILDIRRLKYMLVALLILGYYPNINIPTVSHQNLVSASEPTVAISAESLPEPFTLPHPGYLSTKFSYYHPGVDIATGLGMPVHPIAGGVISDVQYGFWGLGHSVTIIHAGGFQSTYGHLSRIFVKKDQTVTTTNTLGEVGLTGHTSGPHTHLEIQKDGKYIDPLTILPLIPNFPKEADFMVEPKTELRKSLKPDFS